ncbi:unnamed protein product, partial [Eruca vesicaria subsp. sativa]|nr:unnamed protein product [Eruca vesicaria subsp. sativa]
VAWFECTTTIDVVMHDSGWYYIGCAMCHTKATKRPTTLMYMSKISVYDNIDQPYLFSSVMLENESVEDDHIVPVPQALIATIRQTQKFIVKVSNHNLTGKTQTLNNEAFDQHFYNPV